MQLGEPDKLDNRVHKGLKDSTVNVAWTAKRVIQVHLVLMASVVFMDKRGQTAKMEPEDDEENQDEMVTEDQMATRDHVVYLVVLERPETGDHLDLVDHKDQGVTAVMGDAMETQASKALREKLALKDDEDVQDSPDVPEHLDLEEHQETQADQDLRARKVSLDSLENLDFLELVDVLDLKA